MDGVGRRWRSHGRWLEEASAKVRTGPPRDDDEDMTVRVWAGVAPIVTTVGELVPDGDVLVDSFDRSRLIVART